MAPPGGGSNGLKSSSAVELLGKTVRYEKSTIAYSGSAGATTEIKAYLGGRSTGQVEILDASGNAVAVLDAQAGQDGTATVTWDGLIDNGAAYAPAGEYTVKVVGSEYDASRYCFDEGTVNGITNLNSSPQLRVNGELVALSKILDIAASQGASA